MDVMNAVRHRFSVRRYQDKAIPREVLQEVLEAARLAPSAKNRQAWQFVVVTDHERKGLLSQAAKGQDFVAQAPAVIAGVATETGYVMTCGIPAAHVDVAIALEHVALAAVENGLGTCWIGAFYQEQAREILGLPSEWQVVALMPIGYPDMQIPEKRRRPLDEIVRFL